MFQLLGETFVWPVWLPLVGRDHARLLLDNTGRSSCLSTTRASSLPSVWKFYPGGEPSKKYFNLFFLSETGLKSVLPLHSQMVRIARSKGKSGYLFWPVPFNINIWFRHQSGVFFMSSITLHNLDTVRVDTLRANPPLDTSPWTPTIPIIYSFIASKFYLRIN